MSLGLQEKIEIFREHKKRATEVALEILMVFNDDAYDVFCDAFYGAF